MKNKKPSLVCQDGESSRNLRKKLGLNQEDFWGRLSITQSGGSRYESGREAPEQVLWVLHLAYGTEKQAQALVDWLRRKRLPFQKDSN